MKRYTKYLVIIALLFSSISFFTIKKGYGEIYPFFTWMLFHQPFGTEKMSYQYKLYGKNENNTLIRILNNDGILYDGNEKFSIINKLGNEIENSKNVESKSKLLKFAKEIEPNYSTFILVKESFNFINKGKPIKKKKL